MEELQDVMTSSEDVTFGLDHEGLTFPFLLKRGLTMEPWLASNSTFVQECLYFFH
jgi:hypothetical protein